MCDPVVHPDVLSSCSPDVQTSCGPDVRSSCSPDARSSCSPDVRSSCSPDVVQMRDLICLFQVFVPDVQISVYILNVYIPSFLPFWEGGRKNPVQMELLQIMDI